MAGTSRVTAIAFLAYAALGATRAAEALGVSVPEHATDAVAAAALTLALAVAIHTVAAVWRGPTLVRFSRANSVACDRAEAERVRAAAQLRGTLGGAGYVHRARLALPAVAWAATAVLAASPVVDGGPDPSWTCAVIVITGSAALVLPARPFWYREAQGGRVVLHPRDALGLIVGAAGYVAPPTGDAIPRGGATSGPAGWGDSPTAARTGADHAASSGALHDKQA